MIRSARAEDVAAVGQLVRDAYGHYVARMGKQPGPMLDDYARRIADGQVWLLEEEGTLAGVLVLEDAAGGALLLDNLAIAPGAQGKGHGRTLVAYAEAEARRRGHEMIVLYTHVLMVENVAIYRRLGFEETHRVTEKGYDRVYMAKRLG
jgi:N-acetylglutamate synthase-like GNAT family acetyltransferase